jgi:hypothetical protein
LLVAPELLVERRVAPGELEEWAAAFEAPYPDELALFDPAPS